MAARSARIRFDDLQFEKSYSRMRAYGQSKLANLIFAREPIRRSQPRRMGCVVQRRIPGHGKTQPPQRHNTGRQTEPSRTSGSAENYSGVS